ncbi:MAG: proteasome accessory factor PafA2 family protein [Proteobacteria bacterium]|nr:proteasome accessory factor PafA2 family protein [Pseudomonadota bacterium]
MITVKTGGTDRELGVAILGRRYQKSTVTCYEAARRVLKEIDGWPRATSGVQTWYSANPYDHTGGGFVSNPTDMGGKFLLNGSSIYIDLGHLEVCTAECRSALDYTACVQAMLAIVQDAMRIANVHLPQGEELVVYVDNTDRQGNSYGSHLNVTVSRQLWDETFNLRLFPNLYFLASFQASSIVLTGGGKVGSEDGTPAADFQISRRADFIKTFVAEQTTINRPMVNSRDEALGREARLHSIFWDSVVLPAANYLQLGCLQLVSVLMEAGSEWMHPSVILESPIDALRTWSRDPDLTATARLIDGRRVTALEHQELLLDQIERLVATGIIDDAVPDAAGVAAYWRETLNFLINRDWDRAARRVEWLAKRQVLQGAMTARPDLDWQSLAIRHLDMSFGDLNVDRGVYWALLRNDLIDQPVSQAHITNFKHHPPSDTRASARTSLIRQLGDSVASVDWAEIRVRGPKEVFSIHLPDPDQAGIPTHDLAAALIEEKARQFYSLSPHIGKQQETHR